MKKVIKAAALTGGVLCVLKGFDNRLEVTHYNIKHPDIPKEFDGFKIVQLSDYHAESLPGLADAVRCEAPDIIVTTGDMVHDKHSYTPGVRLYEQLSEIAPVYAVTGNHDVWRADYSDYEDELTALGVKTLHDERVILDKNDAHISLSGIDDPFSLDGTKLSNTINKSLSALGTYDGYDILLFHRANMLDLLKNRGFDLILAGHMHGGQFRLPGIGGLVAPKSSWTSTSSAFFPKYFGGFYHSFNTDMIVNRGLGNPMIIPRLFNRPEIVVVHLHTSEHKEEN